MYEGWRVHVSKQHGGSLSSHVNTACVWRGGWRSCRGWGVQLLGTITHSHTHNTRMHACTHTHIHTTHTYTRTYARTQTLTHTHTHTRSEPFIVKVPCQHCTTYNYNCMKRVVATPIMDPCSMQTLKFIVPHTTTTCTIDHSMYMYMYMSACSDLTHIHVHYQNPSECSHRSIVH